MVFALAAGAWLLLGSPFTQATHSPSVATYAFDADRSGSSYNFTFVGGLITQNEITVPSVEPCAQVTSLGGHGGFEPPAHVFQIVAKNMTDMVFYDIRIDFDPSLMHIVGFNGTPYFNSVIGKDTGWINIPIRTTDTPFQRPDSASENIENTNGTSFFADTYQGVRTFFNSPDQPHTFTTGEPYATPDEFVVLAEISMHFLSAADGQLVDIDLTNATTPGNDYGSLVTLDDPGTPLIDETVEETVVVPPGNLLDGQIAVFIDTSINCPEPTPEPTPTPTPTPTPPCPLTTPCRRVPQ